MSVAKLSHFGKFLLITSGYYPYMVRILQMIDIDFFLILIFISRIIINVQECYKKRKKQNLFQSFETVWKNHHFRRFSSSKKRDRRTKLTLTSWLGNWSIAALVFSSWLVKWEGRFVAAALDNWVVLGDTSVAVVVALESALEFLIKFEISDFSFKNFPSFFLI